MERIERIIRTGELLKKDNSITQIAIKLGVSPQTIKSYIGEIKELDSDETKSIRGAFSVFNKDATGVIEEWLTTDR